MEQIQNGKQIVQYLLGELSGEEQSQLDEQLFVNDDYFERALVTEDELIDDYLRGRLSAPQVQLFERTFLRSPHLRRKVSLARSLLRYIDDKARADAHLGVSQLLMLGRRKYALYLCITALFRVALLTSLSVVIFRVARTSGLVQAQQVVFVSLVLLVSYAGLELANLLWSIKDANLALTEIRNRKVTSGER